MVASEKELLSLDFQLFGCHSFPFTHFFCCLVFFFFLFSFFHTHTHTHTHSLSLFFFLHLQSHILFFQVSKAGKKKRERGKRVNETTDAIERLDNATFYIKHTHALTLKHDHEEGLIDVMDNLHDGHRYSPVSGGGRTWSGTGFARCASGRKGLLIVRLIVATCMVVLTSQVLKSGERVSERPKLAKEASDSVTGPAGRGGLWNESGFGGDETGREWGGRGLSKGMDVIREEWHHTRARTECGGCPSKLLCVANLVLTDSPQNVSLLSAGFAVYALDMNSTTGLELTKTIEMDSETKKIVLQSVARNISQLVSKLIDSIVPNLDASLTCLDSLNASAIAETILKAARIVVDECVHVTNVCMKEFLISHC